MAHGHYSMGFSGGSDGKESVCNEGDLGLMPGLGRSPGEGKGHLFQYSGLENPVDCVVFNQIVWSFPLSSAGKESACNAGDLGSMLGLGGSPGEGSGCPLQYSGLENSGLCGPRAQDCHTTHLSRTGFPFSHFVRACLLCL